MALPFVCPRCARTVPAHASACEACGRQRDEGLPVAVDGPQVQPTSRAEAVTAVYALPPATRPVPRLSGLVRSAAGALSPFEAHVVACTNGVLTLREVARAARVSELEVWAVLRALRDRGLVTARDNAGPPVLLPTPASVSPPRVAPAAAAPVGAPEAPAAAPRVGAEVTAPPPVAATGVAPAAREASAPAAPVSIPVPAHVEAALAAFLAAEDAPILRPPPTAVTEPPGPLPRPTGSSTALGRITTVRVAVRVGQPEEGGGEGDVVAAGARPPGVTGEGEGGVSGEGGTVRERSVEG